MNDLLEIIDSILEDANESIVANLNAKVKESTLKVFGGLESRILSGPSAWGSSSCLSILWLLIIANEDGCSQIPDGIRNNPSKDKET